jgi:hypothetical protein
LNEPGSFRINEERDFSKVPERAPSSAIDPEMPSHGLEGSFMLALVHYEKPPMGFSAAIKISLEEEVKSVAQFFECQLDGVVGRYSGFINGNGEKADARRSGESR